MDHVKELIIENYNNLTPSERHIAKQMFDYPKSIIGAKNIKEFANFCTVSESTVVRFIKKINLDGFVELKTLMKLVPQNTPSPDLFIDKVYDRKIKLVNHFRKFDFYPIIELIESSSTIYSYGTGTFQQSYAKEIQRLFMHLGIWVRFIEGKFEFKTAVDFMNEGDTVIIVSSTGKNKMLEEYYDLLSLKNVKILSFTNSLDNPLAYASDYNISTDLNRSKVKDEYHYDDISNLYIPLNFLVAHYIENLIS